MTEQATIYSFTGNIDLAAERLGGKVLACSDDFFAEKENLIKPGRGIFIADKYTDRGKWMDGWESRRKRTPGHDWCIVQLAADGLLRGVDIDTNHFLGNHPPQASVDAARITTDQAWNSTSLQWHPVLEKVALKPGSQNLFKIADKGIYNLVRLNIFPDGGVARLKVYGEVQKDWSRHDAAERIDLAAALNGGKAIRCNDMFFSPMDNLIMPGRGINMGDGWETKRSRIPGNKDWVILRLAHRGVIEEAIIDTGHFKGNYPDSCSVEACIADDDLLKGDDLKTVEWKTLLPQVKLQADHEHHFSSEVINREPFTHVRLTIYPDGGVSRMRLYGHIA